MCDVSAGNSISSLVKCIERCLQFKFYQVQNSVSDYKFPFLAYCDNISQVQFLVACYNH
jgi:hypothetical protein